ncbi:MAG: L-arabinose isomerase [Faecousia sp.]
MLKNYEFWLLIGSQFLYGQEVLDTVDARGREMEQELNASGLLPCKLVYKATVKTTDEITKLMKEANYDDACAGVVTWCHTFSPSKMWLDGIQLLQKPYCQLHTQYHRDIPNDEIDMDFMNLNQAAHGDREHGFLAARLRKPKKIVVGYWKDEPFRKELGDWMRAAVGAAVSRSTRCIRFGDNMRDVAVTEGDKIEAQRKFGWHVDYWPVGHIVETMQTITDAEIDAKVAEYLDRYTLETQDLQAVRYQAHEELAIRKIMEREHANCFINNFQDLYGLEQLPGIASQNIMADGMGYGGEGDWKVSAMTAIMKAMAEGLPGGTSFMEDYNYELARGKEVELGAHMLEVCPSLADKKPVIRVYPLGIGDRQPPARLLFEGRSGKGIVASLIDLGGRFRLILQDIECITPEKKMPNLPVARVMWRPEPDLLTGAKCWIQAGGAHHTVLSTAVTAQMMKDWADIMEIECVHITADTKFEDWKQLLFLNDAVWMLGKR